MIGIIAMRQTTAIVKRPAASEPAWDGFLGTTFLRSDGMAGSYADAATSALARSAFPSTSAPVFTVSCWAAFATASTDCLFDVSDDGSPSMALKAYNDGDPSTLYTSLQDAGVNATGSEYFADYSAFSHLAVVSDGATVTLYVAGVAVGTPGDISAFGPYAAVDAFTLFANYAHALNAAGDIAQLAVWGRALSALEVADLYASGRAFDLRTLGDNEDYDGTTGGPPHWYPGDGDTGTTITDRGSAGNCNLTLHGGVSIEVDP